MGLSVCQNTLREHRKSVICLFVGRTLWQDTERELCDCLWEHFLREKESYLSVCLRECMLRESCVCENALRVLYLSVRILWELYVCLWGCFESSVCLSVCLPVCLTACLPVCLTACLSVCLPVLPVCLSVCLWERFESSVSVCENALRVICLSVKMVWEFYVCLSVCENTLRVCCLSVITPSEFCVCMWERFERAQKYSSVSVCDNTIIEPRSLFSVCSWERFERALKVGCLRLSFRVRQSVVRLSVVVPNVILTNVRSPKN